MFPALSEEEDTCNGRFGMGFASWHDSESETLPCGVGNKGGVTSR